MRRTANFGEDNLLAIKLLLALCVRKGVLLGARWVEFELDGKTTAGAVWHLPASRLVLRAMKLPYRSSASIRTKPAILSASAPVRSFGILTSVTTRPGRIGTEER